MIVHRHHPVSDCRLRLYWTPVYVDHGSEVLGTGAVPSKETVPVARILWPVQLNDGVLAHAAARRLGHAGYTFDDRDMHYEGIGGELIPSRGVPVEEYPENLMPETEEDQDAQPSAAQTSGLGTVHSGPSTVVRLWGRAKDLSLEPTGESLLTRIENFCRAGGARPSVGDDVTACLLYTSPSPRD